MEYSEMLKLAREYDAAKTASKTNNPDDWMKLAREYDAAKKNEKIESQPTNPQPATKQNPDVSNSRLVNVIAGSAKQAASGAAAAAGTALEGMSKISNAIDTKRSAQELEELKQQNQRYAKMYYDGKDANGNALSAAQKDQIWKDMQRNATRIQSMSQTTQARQEQRTANAVQAYDRAAELGESSQRNIEASKDGLGAVGRLAVDVGVGGVQLLGDAAANAITPGAGLAMMGARSFGSGAQKARQAGATYGQQLGFGAATAGLELLTEKMFDGVAGAYGGGAADEIVDKFISKAASTQAGRKALKVVAGALNEGAEEGASGALSPLLERIYNDKALGQYFDPETYAQIGYDMLVGGILGAAGSGVQVGITDRGYGSTSPTTASNATQQTAQPATAQNTAPNAAQARTASAEGNNAVSHRSSVDAAESGSVNQPLRAVIRDSIPQIQGMPSVASVLGNEIPNNGDRLVDRLTNFAKSFGNKVVRPGFGEVLFSKGRIKSSMIGHGVGQAKIDVFAAVPAVIQKGTQFDYQSNWKGRAYDTYTFVAPITYKGSPTYLGVIVTKDSASNRYYLHEVVDENGNVIFANENPASTSDGTSALSGDLDTVVDTGNHESADAAPFIDPTIAQEPNAVKISDGISQSNDGIGDLNAGGNAQSYAERSVFGSFVGKPRAPANNLIWDSVLTAVTQPSGEYGEYSWHVDRHSWGPLYEVSVYNSLTGKMLGDLRTYNSNETKPVTAIRDLIAHDAMDNVAKASEAEARGSAKQAAEAAAQDQNPVNTSDDLSAIRQASDAFVGTNQNQANNDGIGGANTVGSAQSAFDVQSAQNQTRSTDPVFTDAERQMDGLRSDDRTHQVQSHKQTESLAKERLALDYDFKKADLANRTDWDAVDESMAQQILRDLVNDARNTNDYSEVVSWTKLMDERIGEVGRTLNMAGAYADRPETIIGHAAETLDESNLSDEQKAEVMRTISEQANNIDSVDPTDTASLADIVKQNSTIRKTNSLFGNKLSNRMAKLIDGDSAEHLRLIALAQVKNMASDQIRPTFSDSVRSFRIQSMLSNLGTITRNLVGNNVFDPVETIANDISLPLDMLLAQFTGTRSVAGSKSWISKAKRKGSIDAATKSAIEVALDVDTSNAESRYGVSSNRTFHMSGSAFERFMSTWAKWQGYALNTTDEWQKGGIRADVQSGIDALKAEGKVTDSSLDNAGDEAALYTTFQDDNGIGRAMQYAQQAGNALSEGILGKKLPVGFGDWLLPFARVPGNLVARGIDYNPAGAALHTGIDIVDAVLSAKKGNLTAAQQRKIAIGVGRGATGAMLIGLFAAAALKGIIKVPQDDADKDKSALEGAEGISGTQVNLSALKRFAQGESTDWQENDILVSIGFLQPINYLMTTGALLALDMEENGGFSLAGLGKASAVGMMQSLLDMPVMSSLKALVDGYNYSTADSTGGKVIDSLIAGVSDLPASFVPNIVRAGARGLDNNYRVTSRGNKADAVVNGIKATIPGLRETLPEKIDPLGRDKTYTDNTLLNVLNASLLPGAITKYKQSEVGKELERVYQATKRTDFYPNSTWIKKKVTIDGKERVLTDAERDKVQRSAGQEYERQVKSIVKGWAYKNATAAEQADMLAKVRTYAYEKAKTTVLGAEKSALVRKFSEAEKAKVNFADYSYFEANKDADSSGSVTQVEAAQTLAKIMSMTDEQRGVLWKPRTKNGRTKRIPLPERLRKPESARIW